jgi:hypothetical protein
MPALLCGWRQTGMYALLVCTGERAFLPVIKWTHERWQIGGRQECLPSWFAQEDGHSCPSQNGRAIGGRQECLPYFVGSGRILILVMQTLP